MHNIKDLFANKFTLYKIAKILLGVIALIAGANIDIPLKPVPITFQTIIVMVIGLSYAKEEALATLGTYISLGALGLPVFTHFGSTISHLIGPTGGYLAGFLVAAYLMAYLKERFDLTTWLNCIIGHMIIYVLGVSWLSSFIGIEAAIYKGFIIYLPTGIFKIAVLVVIMNVISKQRN